MLDPQDLKDFAKLPPDFTNEADIVILATLESYLVYKRLIVEGLRILGGEDGFKKAECYDFLEEKNLKIRKYTDQKKYAAVLKQMRKEYCQEAN